MCIYLTNFRILPKSSAPLKLNGITFSNSATIFGKEIVMILSDKITNYRHALHPLHKSIISTPLMNCRVRRYGNHNPYYFRCSRSSIEIFLSHYDSDKFNAILLCYIFEKLLIFNVSDISYINDNFAFIIVVDIVIMLKAVNCYIK